MEKMYLVWSFENEPIVWRVVPNEMESDDPTKQFSVRQAAALALSRLEKDARASVMYQNKVEQEWLSVLAAD